MIIVEQDEEFITLKMSKEDWSFIRGAVGAAHSESWPYYRIESEEEYEQILDTYARIDSIEIN